PQDAMAEQSVLGAMLLSRTAIDSAVDVLTGRDFYRPAHELIFDTVNDLNQRGEPADAITVAAELQRRGQINRVGGAPYLHTLVAGVPIGAGVDFHAQIVREKAVLRRLVEVGQRIAQLGYAEQGEVADLVDRAQADVLDVEDRKSTRLDSRHVSSSYAVGALPPHPLLSPPPRRSSDLSAHSRRRSAHRSRCRFPCPDRAGESRAAQARRSRPAHRSTRLRRARRSGRSR